MTDFIIIAVLVIIIGAAVVYIRKAKKSGVKCIGCPSGCNCSHSHEEGSGCNCSSEGCSCHTDENPN